jgi:hypothetical protein
LGAAHPPPALWSTMSGQIVATISAGGRVGFRRNTKQT